MQHRIILSTDLLIAVKGKNNQLKDAETQSAGNNFSISVISSEHMIPALKEEKYFALYGDEHAEAV